MICQYIYIWDNILQLFHKYENMLKILRKLLKERPQGHVSDVLNAQDSVGVRMSGCD